MSTLDDLKGKIRSLEVERSRLAGEVEIMRKAAEDRAVSLEEDISRLRDESKTLREILSSNGKKVVVNSTSKPVALAAVEASNETVPKTPTQTPVREKAPSQAPIAKPVVASPVDVAPPMSAYDVPQNVPDISAQELELEKSEVKSGKPSRVNDSKMLTAEEQKIVNILCDHGGKYARANIRAEAGLGWLQTNRVISRMAERGIIGLEKSGASLELVLKEPPE